MRYRGMIVALLALGLLGFFAVRELRRDKEQGVLTEGQLVFAHGTAEVDAYSLAIQEVGAVRFQRGASGWEVAEGPEGADTAYAPDVLSDWSRVRFVEIVDEEPRLEDLAEYGLAPVPAVRIEATLRSGTVASAPPSLDVGRSSPLKAAYYARIDGRQSVALVSVDVLGLRDGSGRQVLGLESAINERER